MCNRSPVTGLQSALFAGLQCRTQPARNFSMFLTTIKLQVISWLSELKQFQVRFAVARVSPARVLLHVQGALVSLALQVATCAFARPSPFGLGSPVVVPVGTAGRMCGILACLYAAEDGPEMRSRVLALSRRQRHRGPDW
jgi:hypothetical protein